MQLTAQITGLDAARAHLGAAAKQASFAASKAINNAAFGIQGKIKTEMQTAFRGGATAYTQRAFEVHKATKNNLTASVMLRTDRKGGTEPSQTLAHLFTGGSRQYKKLEGLIRAAGVMPVGTIAVPGAAVKLDSRGNISKSQLREILGALRTGLQVVRRKGKQQQAVGYFVLSKPQGKLLPGIYKRVSTGGRLLGGGRSGSGVQPMLVFVRMGTWRQFIDLDPIARSQLEGFVADFNQQLAQALASAR